MDPRKFAENMVATERAATFVDSIEHAHALVNEVLDTAINLSDRLCGAVPEKASSGLHAVPPSNGLFDSLAGRGRDMSDKLDAIRDHLRRISIALP